jgi:hypothetical protein
MVIIVAVKVGYRGRGRSSQQRKRHNGDDYRRHYLIDSPITHKNLL